VYISCIFHVYIYIYIYICLYHNTSFSTYITRYCIHYIYNTYIYIIHIYIYNTYIYIYTYPTSPNCFFQDTFAFQFRLQQISHTSFQASPPLHRRSGEPHRSRCRDGEVRPFAAVAAAVEAVLAPEVTTPGWAEMGRASPEKIWKKSDVQLKFSS